MILILAGRETLSSMPVGNVAVDSATAAPVGAVAAPVEEKKGKFSFYYL